MALALSFYVRVVHPREEILVLTFSGPTLTLQSCINASTGATKYHSELIQYSKLSFMRSVDRDQEWLSPSPTYIVQLVLTLAAPPRRLSRITLGPKVMSGSNTFPKLEKSVIDSQ